MIPDPDEENALTEKLRQDCHGLTSKLIVVLLENKHLDCSAHLGATGKLFCHVAYASDLSPESFKNVCQGLLMDYHAMYKDLETKK